MLLCQENSFRRTDLKAEKLLQVEGLTITFPTSRGNIQAVRNLNFRLSPGEMLAVVGESGSGKSVTGKALLGLVEPPGIVVGGGVWLEGENILIKTEEEKRRLRGAAAGMVYQDPGASFDPVFTVGSQMIESILAHKKSGKAAARKIALEWLGSVGFASPERIFDSYPYELSGGMKQRAYIAMVISLGPRLIVADEPTTALDTVNQTRILSLLKHIQIESGCGVLIISHDLEVVAGISERVLVMYAGQLVEAGLTADVINSPAHPYTRALISSSYRGGYNKERLPIIEGQLEPDNYLDGCSFASRCRQASRTCYNTAPPLRELNGGRICRCLKPVLSERGREFGGISHC